VKFVRSRYSRSKSANRLSHNAKTIPMRPLGMQLEDGWQIVERYVSWVYLTVQLAQLDSVLLSYNHDLDMSPILIIIDTYWL